MQLQLTEQLRVHRLFKSHGKMSRGQKMDALCASLNVPPHRARPAKETVELRAQLRTTNSRDLFARLDSI